MKLPNKTLSCEEIKELNKKRERGREREIENMTVVSTIQSM